VYVEKQNGETMDGHKMAAGSAVPGPSADGSASDSLSVVTCHFHENAYLKELTETQMLCFFNISC
jgi:hypothetical protein